MNGKVLEYLWNVGYEGATLDDFDLHATYFTGEKDGKAYEFKAVEFSESCTIDVYGREIGKEDWHFMDEIITEEAF